MKETVIVIPTYNEEKHIEGVVKNLYVNAPGCRIWVVDGGSKDSTVEKLKNLNLPVVKVFKNPGRIQAIAVNLAAEYAIALGDVSYLIRVDAHGVYPDKFVKTLINTMKEEDADSIVVSMKTMDGNAVQSAASVLFSSWLGNGGSPHRTGKKRGFVSHGHHAAFRLERYLAVGGYDERFVANEDAEFDIRFTKAGHKIFLENRIPIGYVPRKTYADYWRQMLRNGYFRVMTALKHRMPLGLRQIMPAMVAPVLLISVFSSMLFHPLLSAPLILYVFLVAVLSLAACQGIRRRSWYKSFRVAILAIICHNAFSLGVIRSLWYFFVSHPMKRHSLRKERTIMRP